MRQSGIRRSSPSLCGLLDERSDASVHRSLSDLTPLFEDARYSELLILGGDLNPLWSAPVGSMTLARVQSVFDRIRFGFGLIDLVRRTIDHGTPGRGRLVGCTCSLGEACRHVQTFRRSVRSARGCQDDYLFASPTLAARLVRCQALPFEASSTSDHTPLVAEFSGFES